MSDASVRHALCIESILFATYGMIFEVGVVVVVVSVVIVVLTGFSLRNCSFSLVKTTIFHSRQKATPPCDKKEKKKHVSIKQKKKKWEDERGRERGRDVSSISFVYPHINLSKEKSQ